MEKEFTFMGKEMEKISIYYGAFLIFWGLLVSVLSQSSSITSFIPAFFGLPILIFGYLTLTFPSKKKLFMHIAVLFGLLAFLGGFDVMRNVSNLFDNFWADLSKFMLLLTGFAYTYLCIKSFIFARKNKIG
tara:strand:+ start:480 stop:872 length:393 start_codon:yes stop_codon:yes gene_type:complete